MRVLRLNKPGKNLFYENETTIILGRYIKDDGSTTTDSHLFYTNNYIKVEPSTTYTISFSTSMVSVGLCYYTSDKGWISRTQVRNNTAFTFTTPSTCEWFRVTANKDNTTVSYEDVHALKMQLEEGNTATPYEPYRDFTLYPGLKLPKLYVKHHSDDQTTYPDVLENYDVLVDISGGTWVKASGGYYYKDSAPSGTYKIYSNMFSSKSSTTLPRITHSAGRIYIYNSSYETVEELKAAIAGLNVLSLRAAPAGYTWAFVKRMSDNKFGYYCEALNTFFELYTEVEGTLADDIYKHHTLKGGNING